MKEIRIHARAGQGAITTATLLGYVYFIRGAYPYAFPHFGAARMGAPMNAFVRVDDKPVRLRSQIYEPDFVLVADPTLLRGYNCFSGLKAKGVAIINGQEGQEVPSLKAGQKAIVLPANEIAMKAFGRPLGNTALLGAFAAATGEFKLEDLITALSRRFQGKMQEGNIKAATLGYEFVKNKLKG